MKILTVDQKLCTGCSACADVCPAKIIYLQDGTPSEINSEMCIKCGQCVAVCPSSAIDNFKTPKAMQKPITLPQFSAEQAETFLRSRRSIRSFKNQPVPRDLLTELVNVARFAPTGSNTQGISFVIVDNKDTIKQMIELCVDTFEHSPRADAFKHFINDYRQNGVDRILRDAPSIVLAVSDSDFGNGKANATFMLAYLELFAPSLGLGSCWAGLMEYAAELSNGKLAELLNIAPDKAIRGIVMVGYPKHHYKRMVDRSALQVTFL